MSKKHHNHSEYSVSRDHAAEYSIIKHDLLKVVILNAVYLAAILALFYSNKQSGFLEDWFSKIFVF
jgi:hypothetical protein